MYKYYSPTLVAMYERQWLSVWTECTAISMCRMLDELV